MMSKFGKLPSQAPGAFFTNLGDFGGFLQVKHY